MAFGFRFAKGFVNHLPACKFDARNGEFSIINYYQKSESGPYTKDLKRIPYPQVLLIFDLVRGLEVGWTGFPSGKPDFSNMVTYDYERQIAARNDAFDPPCLPEQPGLINARGHKVYQFGFRLLLQIDGDHDKEDKPVYLRQWASQARCVYEEVEKLHTLIVKSPEFLEKDRCPLVRINGSNLVPSGGVMKYNYAPDFHLEAWIERPEAFDDYWKIQDALAQHHKEQALTDQMIEIGLETERRGVWEIPVEKKTF